MSLAIETKTANDQTAADLFTLLKKYNPGLRSLTIDGTGMIVALMLSEKCCRKVAFDLRLSGGFSSVEMMPNRKDGGLMVTAIPKHLK